jgi:hypothetical protein
MGEYDIFVPIPLMENDYIELLHKIFNAFINSPYKILLKFHPMADIQSTLNKARLFDLPVNFSITQDEINDILEKVKVVIGMSSGALFECMSVGLPIIRVSKEIGLEHDPLSYFGDIFPLARTCNEMNDLVKKFLSLSGEGLTELRQKQILITEFAFKKLDSEGLKAFL